MRRFPGWAAAALTAAIAAAPALPKTASAQTQIINLSLVEALVAVGAPDLAGIFAFIPDNQSAMAMADYLMRNGRALKRFIKKGEKDYKDVQGINDWDRQVYLYLINMQGATAALSGTEVIPRGWMSRIHTLSLVPAYPLQMMVQKRAAR